LFFERNKDRFEYAFDVGEDVVVPEAEHAEAARREEGSALRVGLVIVLTAVAFDDEAGL